jgi:trigger factor
MNDVIEKNKDLVFTMNCEVLPEIEITDFSKIKLDKPVSKPKEKDIKDALEYLAKQNKSFEEASEKTKSKDGDQVTLDYVGKIDDIAFDGGTANDANLVLGSKSFIDNFEDQLVGLKKGDKKLVKVKFPDNYPNKDLENKDAEFDVEVLEILNPLDSEINDELAKKFGQEKLKDLKKALEEQIKKDFDQASRMKIKDSLFLELEKKT